MDDVVPLAQALFAKLSAIRNFCLTQEGAEGRGSVVMRGDA